MNMSMQGDAIQGKVDRAVSFNRSAMRGSAVIERFKRNDGVSR